MLPRACGKNIKVVAKLDIDLPHILLNHGLSLCARLLQACRPPLPFDIRQQSYRREPYITLLDSYDLTGRNVIPLK